MRIIKTKKNNIWILAAIINKIINHINNKDLITNKLLMEKKRENEEIVEKNSEILMIRNDRIRRLERLIILKIEKNRKLINDRCVRIQNIKNEQNRIKEKKREVKDKIARRKREYEGKFSEIFEKKNLDDKMLLKVHKMFPDSELINQLLIWCG